MAKLILDIEPDVIKQAENYANETHAHLSVWVESYLKEITKSTGQNSHELVNNTDIGIANWVKNLTLCKTPTPYFDHKAGYREHLDEKHGL